MLNRMIFVLAISIGLVFAVSAQATNVKSAYKQKQSVKVSSIGVYDYIKDVYSTKYSKTDYRWDLRKKIDKKIKRMPPRWSKKRWKRPVKWYPHHPPASAVPEPSAALLFAAGVGVVASRRRR